jgi:hypothetical protein
MEDEELENIKIAVIQVCISHLQITLLNNSSISRDDENAKFDINADDKSSSSNSSFILNSSVQS